VRLKLLGDASPWLHESLSTIMTTFSGEDTSFVSLVRLLSELDTRAKAGDLAAAKVLACVAQFGRLIELAKRNGL
jgi:hypothetical protein